MDEPGYQPRLLIRRVERRVPTTATLVANAVASLALVPAYALAATLIGTPGMRFHLEAAAIALRLLMRDGRRSLAQAGRLALYPMDSTRYFELDWVWTRLKQIGPVGAYLDVSSPRLLPLCCARLADVEHASFVNPDGADLSVTRHWADALAMTDKCEFIDTPIESTDRLADRRFDVITSVSVFEHIVADSLALAKVGALLAPGGTLLLTLPCAAVGYDQFRDWDEYGLSQPNEDGHYFFQRFYDPTSLRERVFAVLGEPRRQTIFGEREPGYFGRNAEQKMRGLPYPFWREPYMMGRHYTNYPTIDALPGEGVVALEFVAPSE